MTKYRVTVMTMDGQGVDKVVETEDIDFAKKEVRELLKAEGKRVKLFLSIQWGRGKILFNF